MVNYKYHVSDTKLEIVNASGDSLYVDFSTKINGLFTVYQVVDEKPNPIMHGDYDNCSLYMENEAIRLKAETIYIESEVR